MPKALTVAHKMSLRNPRHLMRFIKATALSGTDAEKYAIIAKGEGVSVTTVRDSVEMVRQYQAQNSTAEMEYAIRSLVVGAIPKAKQTLDGLLDATELVEIKNPKTGKTEIKTREDKTTRLEAMRIVTSLVDKVQPKGPMVEVTNNQHVQVANLSAAETTEERLRRLRKQQSEANLLPPEVAAVPVSIDREYEPEDDGDADDEGEDE